MAIEKPVKIDIEYDTDLYTNPGVGNNTDLDIVDSSDFDFELEAYLEAKTQEGLKNAQYNLS